MGLDLFHTRLGSGPPILLLHPVGLDHAFWGALPEMLAQVRTVVAVDAAGHGRSPPAARPGRMADRVSDIVRLIERLGMGPATLVGVSFGGMVAQNVAGTRPDLVERLIVAGCPLAMPDAAREPILQRGRDAEANGMDVVVETTLDRWFTAGFLQSETVERVRQRLLTDDPSGWAAAWEAISGHDASEVLANFKGRTLVVAGEKDAATSVDAMRPIAEAASRARMVVLPGAPHIMQLEAGDAFAALVLDFLREEGDA